MIQIEDLPYWRNRAETAYWPTEFVDTIEFLWKKNVETNYLLAQCNTENQNVHQVNLKLERVSRAARIILEISQSIKPDPKFSEYFKELEDALRAVGR